MPAAKPANPRLARGSPLANGCIACYPMHEGSGTLCNDLALRTVNGTAGQGAYGTIQSGATWANGPEGYALSFDGLTGSVVCGTNGLFGLQSQSIEAFVLTKANTDGNVYIIFSYDQGGISNGGYEWSINGGNVGAFGFAYFDTGSVVNGWGTANTSLALNTWYHLVGTYDTTTGVATFYLNGKPDGTWTTAGQKGIQNPSAGSGNAWIANEAINKNWNGLISHLALWNRVLSAAEAEQLAADSFRHLRVRTRVLKATAGGATTITVPAAVVIVSAVAPSFTLGAVSLTVPAAIETTVAVAPQIQVSIAMPTALVSVQAIAPSLTLGAASVAMPAANVSAVSVAPSFTIGAVSLTVPAAIETTAAVAPPFTLGAVPIAVPAATETAVAVAPSLTLGAATVVMPAASVAVIAANPGLSGGLTPASSHWQGWLGIVSPGTTL